MERKLTKAYIHNERKLNNRYLKQVKAKNEIVGVSKVWD